MKDRDTENATDVSINGNMDGNIIVGDGNQITVSSNLGVDRTASELAIKRLSEEINGIKNADVEINQIKKKYYLAGQASDLTIAMSKGLAHILSNLRHKQPSEFLKSWNGHGFKESDLDKVLQSLTMPEMEALKIFFAEYTSRYIEKYKEEPTPVQKYAVKRILEDLERLTELEKSKTLLSRKIEELKRHREIVEKI